MCKDVEEGSLDCLNCDFFDWSDGQRMDCSSVVVSVAVGAGFGELFSINCNYPVIVESVMRTV